MKRVKLCREWEVGGLIGDSHSTHGGGSSACRRIQSKHEVSQIIIEIVRQQPRCFLFLLEKREIRNTGEAGVRGGEKERRKDDASDGNYYGDNTGGEAARNRG